MRKGAWKASLPQHVCIFCATRIQNASAKAPSRPRRRLFASTTAARKPPAGAVVAQKKQNGGDQDWATWTPPAEVFQPQDQKGTSAPESSSGLEAQGMKDVPRASDQHLRMQRESLPRRRVGEGAFSPPPSDVFQSRNGRDVMPRTDGEERRSILRKAESKSPSEWNEGDRNVWQGLRRRVPAGTAQGGRLDDPTREQVTRSASYRKEEQMRRLEASKQSDFVRLEGLQRPKRRRFQDDNLPRTNSQHRFDTAHLTSHQPREQPTASPPYPTELHERERPVIGMINSKSSNPTRYEAQNAQQTPLEAQKSGTTSIYTPIFKSWNPSSAERQKSHGDGTNGANYSPDMYPARSERFLTSSRKPRREDEINAPRDHGRSVGSMTRDGSKIRRQERRRGSREVEIDGDLDDEEFAARRAARKQKLQKAREKAKQNAPPTPILLPEFISVSNLAGVLRIRVEDFLRKMEDLGFEGLTNDHVLDAETAGLVASEYNFEPIVDRSEEQDLKAQPPIEDKSTLPARPPVVTIMGHVDHGKTTLLDFLRKSSVAVSEHGGITQHIGAFSVPMSGGRLVTFLDTPGHAAFLSMRQRGANVTDIVILVVAADDSVKPQTIEAIKHAQSAKVPIIVAVNKIDKEDARPDQVKQDLARYGVEIEDFGGETQVVCVSGKTGQGMAELEDAAVALADILDMRAPTDGPVEGWVLEATTKKAGRVATVLVRRGSLHPGDVIIAGTSWARVRSLRNEAGAMVDSAGPGTPVEIDGWREQPAAGDEVLQSPNNDEQKAKSVIEYRLETSQREQLAKDMTAVNETRRIEQEKREALEKAKELEANANGLPAKDAADPEVIEGKMPETPPSQSIFFILKADVSGSVEAVSDSVLSLGTPEVRPTILRSAVGPITEFDIEHAAVAAGHIINFNTPVDGAMARLAEEKGVRILDQSIIYRLIDQVKGILEEKLPKVVTTRVVGEAEVAQVFDINIKGRVRVPVAGCRIRNGVVGRGSKVRVMRAGEIVFDGSLSSLKHIKKDISEARKGMECGLGFEGWTDLRVGDQVQSYEEKSEQRTL